MRRLLFLALGLTISLMASAFAAEPNHSGHYTSLRYIAEADDYVGVNIDVMQGADVTVDFELCEGWCNGAERFPATIRGDSLAFTYLDRSYASDGREQVRSVPVSGRFVRGGLFLKIGETPPERLKRLVLKPEQARRDIESR